MLMRFDPFREIDRLSEELFSRPPERSVPMDAYRRTDELVIHFDLPGVDPKTVELTVDNDVLLMKAHRAWTAEPTDESLVRERYQGDYVRRVMLGRSVDTTKIKARYEDGVLTIHLPVAEKAKKHKIEVARPAAAQGSDIPTKV